MIDKQAFEAMRKEIEAFDDYREQLIKRARDVLKDSKASIYSVHRGDLKNAKELLASAKKGINEIEGLITKDVHLAEVGAYAEALEEYAEAACYYGFTTTGKLPTAKELGIDTDVYLPGLCDLVGSDYCGGKAPGTSRNAFGRGRNAFGQTGNES